MEKIRILQPEEAIRLRNIAKNLKPGELIEGQITNSRIDDNGRITIAVTFSKKENPLEILENAGSGAKIISFNGARADSDEPAIVGQINGEWLRRRERKHHKIDRDWMNKMAEFLGRLPEKLLSGLITTEQPEDPGQEHIDKRGFAYSYIYDMYGNPSTYCIVDINGVPQMAIFLDEERTIVDINGKLYRMNDLGLIVDDPELDNDTPPTR